MPWDANSFKSRHNHGLTGPEAIHAAHIANAILRSGEPDGIAIATANKMASRASGGILGGGLGAVSTPTLQNFTQSPAGTGNTNALALANTQLAQRPVPSSIAGPPLTTGPTAFDAGGGVDPNQGGVGGIAPSATATNPILKSLAGRYASLPTEKLTELSSALKGSPQGQVINTLLSQRRIQPNAQGQPSAGPQTMTQSLQPNPALNTGAPVAVAAGGAIKKRAAGAGIAVRVPSGEVLFLKRAKGGDHPGTWCFPGGGIEAKETPEQAARREFREETGHEISGKLPALHRAPNGYVTFGAEIPKTFTPRINDEHTEFKWAHPDDAPQPLHPGVRAALALARRTGGYLPKRDMGGGMSLGTLDPSWTRQDWRQAGDVSTGFLGGASLGRADSIRTKAPAGSYILPSDVISGLGEGNSLAGSRVFDEILHSMPYGIQGSQQKGGRGSPRAPSLSLSASKGGEVKDGAGAEPVDVLLSDGERVVLPHHVKMFGAIAAQDLAKKHGGSPDRWDKLKLGHRVLDSFVLNERAKHIKKLKSLPGPVRPRDKAA